MDESDKFDEVFLGFEPSSATSEGSMVMRRHYRKQFTPDEAHKLFLDWFTESFLPAIDELGHDSSASSVDADQ